MPEQIRLTLDAEVKALKDERALVVKITSPHPDRSGDVVVPKGGKLENFLKNPVVLFGHDYWSPPIAKAAELSVSDEGILAKVQFPTKGTSDFADMIYELYLQGIMNAWSIGFRAIREKIEILAEGGRKFNEWELFEFSAVPVPAHPEALTLLRSAGYDDQFISKALDAEVLEPEEKQTEAEPETEVKDIAVELNEETKAFDLSFSIEGKQHTISYPLTDEQKSQVFAKEQAEEQLSAAIHGMRDALKAKDATLLTTLQTMKTLIDKGGEI